MLDLDAGVDLDEVETVRVGIDEKFDRAGILVACQPTDRQRRVADRLSHARIEVRCRCHLDHLLVAPLHGAIALEEVNEAAVHVAEELDLDMAGALDELLDEDLGAAEGGLAFTLSAFERHGELVLAADDAHAAAAAAVRRLDHHRPAESFGDPQGLCLTRHRVGASREDRNSGPLGQIPGRRLVAERLEKLDTGADERHPGGGAGGGKLGILGEEPVARMDGIDAMRLGERHDRGDVEVGADRLPGTANEIGFVGFEAVQGEAVFVRVDRHRADAQFVGRAEDADGDLRAVGDQQLLDGTDHGRFLRTDDWGPGGKNRPDAPETKDCTSAGRSAGRAGVVFLDVTRAAVFGGEVARVDRPPRGREPRCQDGGRGSTWAPRIRRGNVEVGAGGEERCESVEVECRAGHAPRDG